MPGLTPRTRLIFQNSNVFVAPAGQSGTTATGALYSSGNSGVSFFGQISRVQSVDISASINRTDINVFGQLGRIDSEILTPSTFTLNFSYYLTDGSNENVLGLSAKGGASFVSGLLTKTSDAKNYFVSYSPQGVDDNLFTIANQRDVVSIGNGFISNYSISAAINQPVSASVSVDGLNIAAFTGSSGNITPAIDPATALRINQWTWQLPTATAQTGGNSFSILKPGDITISIPNAAGFNSIISGAYGANIQSFTLSIPISRTRIQKLGSPFGISNEIQFPVDCSLSVQALQTDLQANSFDQYLCSDNPISMNISMRQPSCNGTGLTAINLGFNSAFLTNWSLGQTIGGDASLSLQYTSQLTSPLSLDGIVFSGSY